jgi:hypothetical protein
MTTEEQNRLVKSFNFLQQAQAAPTIQAPAVEEVQKPRRTVGNIYVAAQGQAVFNPGQPAPPDPNAGSGAAGPVGTAKQKDKTKAPAAKQVDLGTSGSLQENKGWTNTNG